jgi:hypothetical protein
MRYATLWTLVRLPFLSAADLAELHDISSRAARAQLAHLCQAEMAAYVARPEAREHLYYLTAIGIKAARSARADPDALTARYGLSERALLRRLPGLARLVAGRSVLIALHGALRAAGGALEEWRAWPVPWRAPQGPRWPALSMDGEATLAWPEEGGRCRIGYLWDGDETVPPEVLHERLGRLEALRQAPASTPPSTARVPPVLVVTADAARIPAGYRPGVLWTTTAAITASGPLEAAWRGSTVRGEVQPLRSALATVMDRPCVPPPGPAAAFPVRGAAVPGLAERARAVRDGTARAGEEGLGLLTFALPPRALDLLALVGAHPLFSAAHLARARPLARSDRMALLALLCRHELLTVWRAPEGAGEWRYVLTPRGLRVLALRAGVTPQVYRRVYGVLESSVTAARKGLPLLQRTLAHTDAIHDCYLALRQGAEERGGTLWWRGDWACPRTYRDGERLCTVRPDAEGGYRDTTGGLSFYLELDRGTTSHRKVDRKLGHYYAYRATTTVTVLLVTLGSGRCREVLHRVEALAVERGTVPLDVRATTLNELRTQGPWASIWRTLDGTCGPLALAPVTTGDAVVLGAPSRTNGGKDR